MYPIIVIGPPRSGTSNVARVLHEYFNVFMGWRFWKPEFAGVQGTYEDMCLMEANMLFEQGFIKIKPWQRRFRRFVRARERMEKPWGFKDPRLIQLLPYALDFFDSPTIIRCHRDRGLVVKSQMDKLGWSEQEASKYYDFAEGLLNRFLSKRDHLLVHYPEGERFPEQRLVESLGSIEFSHATT